MPRLFLLILAFAFSLGFARAAEHHPAGPHPADVVCFGDSITYRGYPQLLATNLGVTVVNSGVAGNTSSQGLARIQKDVLDHTPKIVVVLFGTNDSRAAEPSVCIPVPQYEANLSEIVNDCQKIHAQVVLTIPPIDAESYYKRHNRAKLEKLGGLDAVLKTYRDAQARVAEKYKLPMVDLNTILATHSDWREADGVHPTKAGNQIIADEVGKVVGPLLKK